MRKENDNTQQIKIEYDEGLSNYFKALEGKQYKPLKRDDERKLMCDFKNNNDLVARQKLISANLRYACKLVNKYADQGVSISDLIEEANCGLIEAVDRYDLNYDVKVITYAKWYIENKMQEAIKDKNKNSTDALEEEFTDYDINDSYESEDSVTSFDDYDQIVMKDEKIEHVINNALSILTDKERDFVEMYYGIINYDDDYTYEDIGIKYGISKERTRQIIDKAMRKLRVQVLKNE